MEISFRGECRRRIEPLIEIVFLVRKLLAGRRKEGSTDQVSGVRRRFVVTGLAEENLTNSVGNLIAGDPDRIRTDDLWLDRPIC